MTDTVTTRLRDLISILDHDSAHAVTHAHAARTLGVTIHQLDYLLRTNPEAQEAWQVARQRITDDRCATRRCNMCGVVKPAAEFPVDRRDGCGFARRCLVCNRLAVRLYRQSQAT